MPHVRATSRRKGVAWQEGAPVINVNEGTEIWIDDDVWEDTDKTFWEVVGGASDGAEPTAPDWERDYRSAQALVRDLDLDVPGNASHETLIDAINASLEDDTGEEE